MQFPVVKSDLAAVDRGKHAAAILCSFMSLHLLSVFWVPCLATNCMLCIRINTNS